eukprot:7160542-Lingulodinium_polyedra.AAC.1
MCLCARPPLSWACGRARRGVLQEATMITEMSVVVANKPSVARPRCNLKTAISTMLSCRWLRRPTAQSLDDH